MRYSDAPKRTLKKGRTYSEEIATWQVFAAGDRVYFLSTPPLIRLTSKTGTILGPDMWDGFYIIHLDTPALDKETGCLLQEIREAGDALGRIL